MPAPLTTTLLAVAAILAATATPLWLIAAFLGFAMLNQLLLLVVVGLDDGTR